jgi:hypothetical protein
MAGNTSEFFEREGRRWAKIHAAVAIGALAAEAVLFPHALFLEDVTMFEGLHALVLEGIHRVAKSTRPNKTAHA